jgi:hypothetical protein
MKHFQPRGAVTAVVFAGAMAAYLPQCLESLLEQSQAPQQIVLISPGHAHLPVSALPLLRYVTHVDGRAWNAWRKAEASVRTPYLLPLWAHDELYATALEALELVLDVRSHTGMVQAQASTQRNVVGKCPEGALTSSVTLLRCAAMRQNTSMQDVFARSRTDQHIFLLQPGWPVFTITHYLAYHHLVSADDVGASRALNRDS